MPDRIIKESICRSETLNGLSWFEEVFFERLIVNCDDFGRFDARPSILKSYLFPLKANITEKSILETLNKLSTVGLIDTYIFDGQPYLQLKTWERHQRIRAKRSKFPSPDDNCCQLTSIDVNSRRNPIQSNPNPNPNPNPKGAFALVFEEAISEYPESTKVLLRKWYDVRKAKRAANTEGAITGNLEKLESLAKESNLSVDEYLSEVVRRGWQAFYAINDYKKNGQKIDSDCPL